MKPLRLLALFFSLFAGLRAADSIQVAGVLSMGPGKAMVRLVNATTGHASWVSVGDTFSGYRVQSYNASADGKSDSVTLTGNGAPLRLSLSVPKIRSSTARGGTTATPTPAGAASSFGAIDPNTPMIPLPAPTNAEPGNPQAGPTLQPPPPPPPAN